MGRFLLFLLLFTVTTLLLTCLFVFLSERNETEEESASGHEIGRVTVIDAGHGGEDGGASDNGLVEKGLNLDVARKLAFLFETANLPYRLTREDDRMLYKEKIRGTLKMQDLRERLSIVESYRDARLVSIHMNRFPSPSVKGLQVWYSPNNGESREMAEKIRDSVKATLQPDNTREVKKAGSSIFLLNRCEAPAVLVECGFLSNPDEATALGKAEYRSSLAASIFSALLGESGKDLQRIEN